MQLAEVSIFCSFSWTLCVGDTYLITNYKAFPALPEYITQLLTDVLRLMLGNVVESIIWMPFETVKKLQPPCFGPYRLRQRNA